MGFYVNPDKETKEEFLVENGILVQDWEYGKPLPVGPNEVLYGNIFPVVWINNGPFTAAGIAFNEKELKAFMVNPNDFRDKLVWLVPKDKLLPVTEPYFTQYLEELKGRV